MASVSNPWKAGGKFSSPNSDDSSTTKTTPKISFSGRKPSTDKMSKNSSNTLKPLSEQIQATSVPNLQEETMAKKLMSSKKNDEFGSSTNLDAFLNLGGGRGGISDDEADSGPIRLGKVVGAADETSETKNWSLSKNDKAALKDRLSDVMSKRSGRSPSPNLQSSPLPKIDLPKNLPPIPKAKAETPSPVPKSSVSSKKASSSKRVDDLTGPDLEIAEESSPSFVKPSAVKASQPKSSEPVQFGASSESDSKAPKNISKEALLNMYNTMWDNADDIPEPEIIKCGLPEVKRPAEEENLTDVEDCIRKLEQNDPTLKDMNMNNMKRTPVPQIQRMLESLRDNEHLEKLSLANLALTDSALAPLLEVVQVNTTLKMINLETNFLTGDFFVKLFLALLKTQTLQEVKAVNQSTSLGQKAETAIMKAIHQNRGLSKVSMTIRIPEVRQKIDQALIRNGELRRLKRQIEAMETKNK